MSFKSGLKRLATAASIAALTVSVSFAAPAQKANAQLSGAGATSVLPLTGNSDDGSFPGPLFQGQPVDSYRSIGSGAGRNEFINGNVDFAATDVRSNQTLEGLFSAVGRENIIAVTPAGITVVFPFNVPGFNATLPIPTACAIFSGSVTNWNEVTNSSGEVGPDLLITRVFRSDVSDTTSTLSGLFTQYDPDHTLCPEDPFPLVRINAQGNLEALTAIASTEGAIGYADRSVAAQFGFTEGNGNVATFGPTGGSEVVVGSTYFVFRREYGSTDQAAAARSVCNYIASTGQEIAAGFGYAAPTGPNDNCDDIGPFSE